MSFFQGYRTCLYFPLGSFKVAFFEQHLAKAVYGEIKAFISKALLENDGGVMAQVTMSLDKLVDVVTVQHPLQHHLVIHFVL